MADDAFLNALTALEAALADNQEERQQVSAAHEKERRREPGQRSAGEGPEGQPRGDDAAPQVAAVVERAELEVVVVVGEAEARVGRHPMRGGDALDGGIGWKHRHANGRARCCAVSRWFGWSRSPTTV